MQGAPARMATTTYEENVLTTYTEPRTILINCLSSFQNGVGMVVLKRADCRCVLSERTYCTHCRNGPS